LTVISAAGPLLRLRSLAPRRGARAVGGLARLMRNNADSPASRSNPAGCSATQFLPPFQSSAAGAGRRAEMRPGDAVRILRGPFEGHLAIYHGMKPRQRVEVLLSLLGSRQRMTLAADAVEAVP